MRELLVFDSTEPLVQLEEEPALDIALPQVFTQPELPTLQRGKLPHVELLVTRLYNSSKSSQENHQGNGALGSDYQALVNEFQPLFTWAIACWDYLLSTEGCRFLLRGSDETLSTRGDYRVVTDRDYSRLVHRLFRQCVMDFAQQPQESTLSGYLRRRFWPVVVEAYRTLENPPDPRQRKLTPYSYLRCIPYQFLNRFHHELVSQTLQKLPDMERDATSLYFLHFFTLQAASETMRLPVERVEETLRQSLLTLLLDDRLVYCLLRQIERY